MFKPASKYFLILFMLLSSVVVVQANVVQYVWKMVQGGSGELGFQFQTSPEHAETHMTLSRTGVMTLGMTASGYPNMSLMIDSVDKAVLVTRLADMDAIVSPENGMIAYFIDASCFRVYQSDDWSACLGVSDRIPAGGTRTGGSIGDIYYDTTREALYYYNEAREWKTADSGQLLTVVDELPTEGGIPGSMVFLTTNERLYLFHGGQYIPLEFNFDDHHTVRQGAWSPWIQQCDSLRDGTCPASYWPVSLHYDYSTFGTDQEQKNRLREFGGVLCCRMQIRQEP